MIPGIERLSFYVPTFYLPLSKLAAARGVDVKKYHRGLGQDYMAVVPPDQDIVSMAAAAGDAALETCDRDTVDAVIVATEGGVDQSKSAAMYVHRLLSLRSGCMAYEVKQACAAGTAGLLQGLAMIRAGICRRVLLIATDIARYRLGSPGEPTQGAGACAVLLSSNPAICTLGTATGVYTEEAMDFWRPAYQDVANVDGKYSIQMYLKALEESWRDFGSKTRLSVQDFSRFIFHMPFSALAQKGVRTLSRIAKSAIPDSQWQSSTIHNRVIGNTYTASLFIGLASLLENDEADLTGKEVALYSYGSGSMGIFMSGRVSPGYQDNLQSSEHRRMLARRQELDIQTYEGYHDHQLPVDGSALGISPSSKSRFRLTGIRDHKRIYEGPNAVVAEKVVRSATA
ncbi:MAG: hydroxymethylglutaryl-CoA synthase [Rhodothermales bacterium]